MLDGEVCALDEEGRATFSAMQQGKPGTRSSTLSSTCSRSTASRRRLPYTERRKRLQGLLDKRNRVVQFSEAFDDGEALYEAAKQQRFEGIMAKRPSRPICRGAARATG